MNKDFFETDISYAIIMRGDIETIQEVKEYLSHIPNLHMIYQKWSVGKLYITDYEPSEQGALDVSE